MAIQVRVLPADITPAIGCLIDLVISSLPAEEVSVCFYYDERETTKILVVSSEDGATNRKVASTIGLHEVANLLGGTNIPVELLIEGPIDGTDRLEQIISTAAFFVAKNGWLAAPGVLFPSLISEYFPSTSVPDCMWTEPTVWPELSSAEVEGLPSIHWLSALPISRAESEYLREHGYDSLDGLLDGVQIGDLDRRTVV